MGALEPLIESDVDIQALDEYPMSEDEVQQLHDDAVARRTHDEANPNVVGEARAEFVEPAAEEPAASSAPAPRAEAGGKGGKSGKGGKGGMQLP